MPPEPIPFDPQRILEVLARHQVQCVVIGGYAAVLAGVDVVTRDIDITPAIDPANLQRLAGALSELHAAIRVRVGEPPVPLPADPRLLARAETWNFTTDAGDRVSAGHRPQQDSGRPRKGPRRIAATPGRVAAPVGVSSALIRAGAAPRTAPTFGI